MAWINTVTLRENNEKVSDLHQLCSVKFRTDNYISLLYFQAMSLKTKIKIECPIEDTLMIWFYKFVTTLQRIKWTAYPHHKIWTIRVAII